MTSKEKKDIVNFYEHKELKKLMPKNDIQGYDIHHIALNSRTLICASSGGGKSNAILNFIQASSGSFQKIHFFVRSMEPLYDFLQSKIGENLIFYTNINEFPDVNEVSSLAEGANSLCVFDDFVSLPTKQTSIITDYCIRGRKQKVTLVLLVQSYFSV